jgi:hypothetical protein
MKIKDNLKIVLLWIFLNICVIILLQLQTYMESRPGMKEELLINKIKKEELFALLELIFLIPIIKVGMTFMTIAQTTLISFILLFISQIFADSILFEIPMSLDDYIAIIMIIGATYISLYRILG